MHEQIRARLQAMTDEELVTFSEQPAKYSSMLRQSAVSIEIDGKSWWCLLPWIDEEKRRRGL